MDVVVRCGMSADRDRFAWRHDLVEAGGEPIRIGREVPRGGAGWSL